MAKILLSTIILLFSLTLSAEASTTSNVPITDDSALNSNHYNQGTSHYLEESVNIYNGGSADLRYIAGAYIEDDYCSQTGHGNPGDIVVEAKLYLYSWRQSGAGNNVCIWESADKVAGAVIPWEEYGGTYFVDWYDTGTTTPAEWDDANGSNYRGGSIYDPVLGEYDVLDCHSTLPDAPDAVWENWTIYDINSTTTIKDPNEGGRWTFILDHWPGNNASIETGYQTSEYTGDTSKRPYIEITCDAPAVPEGDLPAGFSGYNIIESVFCATNTDSPCYLKARITDYTNADNDEDFLAFYTNYDGDVCRGNETSSSTKFRILNQTYLNGSGLLVPATTTPNVYDYCLARWYNGEIIATTSIRTTWLTDTTYDYYNTSTLRSASMFDNPIISALGNFIGGLGDMVSNIFPFNAFVDIYEAWGESENVEMASTSFAVLWVLNENGDLPVWLPTGATTTVPIFSTLNGLDDIAISPKKNSATLEDFAQGIGIGLLLILVYTRFMFLLGFFEFIFKSWGRRNPDRT